MKKWQKRSGKCCLCRAVLYLTFLFFVSCGLLDEFKIVDQNTWSPEASEGTEEASDPNPNPTVSITSSESGSINTSPINLTITFSKAVTGFVLTDITTTNGSVSGFSGSGSSYTVSLTPTGEGLVTVDIPGGVCLDSATGLYSNTAASQYSITYDSIAPTIGVVNDITPYYGSSGNSPATNITIKFTEVLDSTVFGTVTYGVPSFSFVHGTNCTMSISGDTLTIDPTGDLMGGSITDITVSGFTDPAGNVMANKNYNAYTFSVNGLVLNHYFNSGDMSDSSGRNNHATNVGTISTSDRFLTAGKAQGFDGATAYIKSGFTDSTISQNNFTISVWVSPGALGVHQPILSKDMNVSSDHPSSSEMQLQIKYDDNRFRFIMGDGGGSNWDFVQSPDSVSTGSWYHVAVVKNSGNLVLYVNGALKDSRTLLYTPASGNNQLQIGTSSDIDFGPGSKCFTGKIDDVRIYNYGMSGAQVYNLYSVSSGYPIY